jgi:hypothetical protein
MKDQKKMERTIRIISFTNGNRRSKRIVKLFPLTIINVNPALEKRYGINIM